MSDDITERQANHDLKHDPDSEWQNVRLSLSEDRMKVSLICNSADIERDGLGEEVVQRLKAMGIAKIPEPLSIIQLIAEHYPPGAESAEITLIEGVPPEESHDAKIEWQGNFFTPGYFIDPVSRRIDFRQKASQPTVEKDQLLVVIHPPVEGKPGSDVTGRKINVASARKSTLQAGHNVYWSERDSGFRAKTEGQVKLTGKKVDVDEVLNLRDGVGTASGNVDHRGQVLVGGDIESEFKVSATGNIEVKGVVLAADVNCGGNLVAVEGINSSHEKKIHVKGDIVTKYILNASVVCDGNITANREIYQCHIKSRGEVICGSGRIIGGEIIAAKAIEAEEAGSKADTKTVLIAGVDYAEYEKLEECKQKIKEIRDAAKILNCAKRKLEQIRLILTADQKRHLVELTIELNDYLELEKSETEEAQRIHREMVLDKSAYIKISGLVYPGVALRLYDSSYIVQHALKGPLKARIDPGTLQIAVTSDEEKGKELET